MNNQKPSHSFPILNDNQSGFTLLEILIAIVLLSFLMIGVYSLVDGSVRTRDNTLKEDLEFVDGESALHRFEMDFSLIYSPLYYSVRYTPGSNAASGQSEQTGQTPQTPMANSLEKYQATERYPAISKKGIPVPAIMNESKESLAFFYSGNKRNFEGIKESNFAWVKYALIDDPNPSEGGPGRGRAFARYHQTLNPYTPDFNWNEVRPTIILRNVKSLEFFFWESERKTWVDSIRSLSNQTSLRIVKVILVWVDQGEVEHKTERIIRALWPSFETGKDDMEYTQAMNKSTGDQPPDGAPPPAGQPPPASGDEDE